MNKKWLILGVILLLGIGFASISTILYINGDVNISSNEADFDVKFTKAIVDNVDQSSIAISEDGKTINFTTKELEALNDKSVLDFEVTNNSYLYDAEVSIECTSGERGEYYQITKNIVNTILAKATEKGKVEVEKTKLAPENIEETFTCTLNAKALERPIKGEKVINKNIVNNDLECLKNKEAGSCTPGTVINYMVNDTTEKAFHVLHDDGETLILQDSIITLENKKWYYSAENNRGPIMALNDLGDATKEWSNVNTLNYTMGTTSFNGTNAYTGCSELDNIWGCTTNTYTLENRSAKARMITAQEAIALGCTLKDNSCPSWLTSMSTSVWTMTAHSSQSDCGLSLSSYHGSLGYNLTTNTIGIKAVVEITK